jgi:hypothetical protein
MKRLAPVHDFTVEIRKNTQRKPEMDIVVEPFEKLPPDR